MLKFKTLVLSALDNLSDDQIGYQVRDRRSFMRFLGLGLGDPVPDAKRSQKDTDARWSEADQKTVRGTVIPASKHGKSRYGYKNHANVDRQHKAGRGAATSAMPPCTSARRWIAC